MRIFLILFNLLLIISCSKEQKGFHFLKKSEPSITYKSIKVSNLHLFDTLRTDIYQNEFDSIKFIKLQLTEDCVLGSLDFTHIYKDKIIVVDRQTNTINIFNFSGKCLSTIKNIGSGPGQYSSISNVLFDEDNIYITDFMSRKFLHYDIYGNFIKERININSSVYNVQPLTDTTFIDVRGYYNGVKKNQFELVYTDINQETLGTIRPHQTNLPLPGGKLIKNSNNDLLYYKHLCDTVFLITDNNIKPYLCLGLYTKEKLEEFYAKAFTIATEDWFKFINLQASIPVYYTFLENDNYYVVQFNDDMYSYTSFISKKDFVAQTYLNFDLKKGKYYNLIGIKEFANNDWIVASISEREINSISRQMIEDGVSMLPNELLKRSIITLSDTENNGLIILFHIKAR